MIQKVLFVMNEPLHKGGSQGVMMNIVRKLSGQYLFDILLFCDEKSYYDDEFISYGGRVFHHPHYKGQNKLYMRSNIYIREAKVYRAVFKCISENGPYKVVHCMNGFEAGFALKAAYENNIGVRISHSLVVTDTKKHLLRSIYNRLARLFIEKYATHKISVSREAQSTSYDYDQRCHIITPSYNDTIFDPTRYDEMPFDNPQLIQIGSYSPNKNQMFSAEVLKEIIVNYPNATLKFIGFDTSGVYINQLKKFVEDNNLSNNIEFYEHDADIPYLLNESTHLLLPSIHEGFGIVLIESQAMGIPCVVSDSVSNAADVNGCVFLPLNMGPKAWADVICNNFRATGGAHMHYDCCSFTDEAIAKKYLYIYLGKRA